MSSTESDRLDAFFREKILPAAKRLSDRGIRFFPLGPDESAQTYFQGPPAGPDFFTLDVSMVGTSLRQLWSSQDLPELEKLVDGMMELSALLEETEGQTSEISPFVYVMY